MTVEPVSPERLSEIMRLCTVLADQALDAKIMGRPLPADQTVALAKAARLLQDQPSNRYAQNSNALKSIAAGQQKQGQQKAGVRGVWGREAAHSCW